MTKKGIVILGAGLLQTPLIKAAKKRGWFVISVDINENAPGIKAADEFLKISTRDADGLIHALRDYVGKFHHCGTLGTDMTATIASVNQAFELGGLTIRQAEVTTHKGKMRQFLSANGLKQPDFIITNQKSIAQDWAIANYSKNGFVIKPVHNMGARGVMKLNRPEDLSFAFEYASSHSIGGEIILEEYIEADELSVDALCVNGETYITGLADRCIEIRQGRYFIETGHTMPTQKNRRVHDKVLNEIRKISQALGDLEKSSYTGALKGDIRLTSDESVIVGEVATRLSGGFMSTHTYPLASGNDLLNAYLDVLENKTPQMCLGNVNDIYQNVTIERAFLSQPGRVEIFEIPNDFLYPEAIVQNTFIHCKSGDYIASLQSNLGKPGNAVISASTLSIAENCASQLQSESKLKVHLEPLTRKEINQLAREKFNKNYCHVCKICDGINCASGVPGMGGTGKMKAFQDNLMALGEIKLNYNRSKKHINDQIIDTKAIFLNKTLPFPVLNAPITGSITNMGSSITEYDHAIEIAMGMKELGLPAMFGDGASPDKYFTAIEAIRQSGGGFLVIKPRQDNDEIIRRVQDAESAGADGWGIDIDAVKLVTMENKNQRMSKKSIQDLRKISLKSKLPFFIKGVMTVEESLEMADAGAGALIVSNHGGRINDDQPGSARVIGAIVTEVKKHYPEIQIFADGGIRSGEDVFKMLALGADGVLVGRPISIAAVAAARLGAYSVLKTYFNELQTTMKKLSLDSISKINSAHITF
ncbi:MAG: alpha-hydroxy-acid oxidizing protein [Spirochaetia bacterium]|nr:alpha-hydroxy-acid oxidizing protein [Spirochaetia bacterium]